MALSGTPHSFPALKRCMYCGRADVPLSREHIIPYGLGGTLTMRKSSCKECADITKEIEQQCLRPMFGALRIRQGYPTNNPKNRPKRMSIPVGYGDDNSWHNAEELEVPVEDIPVFLALPTLPPPGILKTRNPSNLGWWFYVNESELDAFHAKYGNYPSCFRLHPLLFFRLLAKIAHGFAVGVEGYDSFEPLLIDLIRGEKDTSSQLIGCDPDPEVPGNRFYSLRLDHYLKDGVLYVGVNVRLFEDLRAPTYIVIVGRRPYQQRP